MRKDVGVMHPSTREAGQGECRCMENLWDRVGACWDGGHSGALSRAGCPWLAWPSIYLHLLHLARGSSQHTASSPGSHPNPKAFPRAPLFPLMCSQVKHFCSAEAPFWDFLSTNTLGLCIPPALRRAASSSATVCKAGGWCHAGSSARFTVLFPQH